MKNIIYLILLFPAILRGQCFTNGGEPFTDSASGFSDTNAACTTATKENTPLSIFVFPNPTSDILTIEGKQKEGRVQIYDATGRKILETTNSVLDFFSFTQGLYFLRIEKQVFKVVKL
jgi:hypothetical protein